MNRRSESNAVEDLRQDWRRWTGMIAAASRGRAAKLHLDPAGYQALYQRLMTVSRELAQSGDEAQRSIFEVMEATVRPWLSPRVLEQADREILGHVLERCRRVERVLDGRKRVSWRAAGPMFLFVTASAVSFFLLWMASSRPTALQAVQSGMRAFWSSVERLSQLEQLFVVGLLVVVVSIYNASRAARS